MEHRRRKIFWFAVAALLSAALAAIIVPPFINLSRLVPHIEYEVLSQTGLHINIRGPVRLSVFGRATITAYDVEMAEYGRNTAGAKIKSVQFRIPYRTLLDLNTASLSGTIVVDGARLHLESLAPPSFSARIMFKNGSLTFRDRTLENVNGVFRDGVFNGALGMGGNKYTFESDGRYFIIKNPSVNLDIKGRISTDDAGNASVAGKLSLDADNINRRLGFQSPEISGRLKLQSDFEWLDGTFAFHNVSGELGDGDFTGDLVFGKDHKKINLVANNMDLDLSFLVENPAFLHDSEISFAGNGRFLLPVFRLFPPLEKLAGRQQEFDRIKFVSNASGGAIDIIEFNASNADASLSASGPVAGGAAAGLDILVVDDSSSVHCVLRGTKDDWSCERWDYVDAKFSASGALAVRPDSFEMTFGSQTYDYAGADANDQLRALGALLSRDAGAVRFALKGGLRGAAQTRGGGADISYTGRDNVSLGSVIMKHDISKLLPAPLLRSRGTIRRAEIKDGKLASFDFEHEGSRGRWRLMMDEDGAFSLEIDARRLLAAYHPDLEAKFLKASLPMLVTGRLKSPYVSDLGIIILDGRTAALFGKFDGRTLDLHSEFLDLDQLLNPGFIDDYDAEKYVSAEPLTFPFALNLPLTLTADVIKFGGEEYSNFVYSVKNGSQKMSITDSARGSLLVSIEKKLSKYNLLVQSNKFEILGTILPAASKLNIADTTLTAQAQLSTSGITANDFWRNMSGDMDMTFDGGTLVGFDTDRFYDRAQSITTMNAEYAISDALGGGQSRLKSLRIAGRYQDGGFRTTTPLEASTRHAEYTGHLQTSGGRLSAQLKILLRGTSPVPAPVSLNILPNGERDYSLSEIMQSFDPDFMREFTKMYNKF